MAATFQQQISQGIRSARLSRRLTQAELAQKLGISQSRLSEIEQGKGSITAEQFIVLLQFFNLPISHFVQQEHVSFEDQLQNRLIQLGSSQLREKADTLPSEKLADIQSVVIEVLVKAGFQRLILGLVPVIIQNVTNLNLLRTCMQLNELGLQHRLLWLVDGILSALSVRLKSFVSRERLLLYRQVFMNLKEQLMKLEKFGSIRFSANQIEDVLDSNISSQKTLDQVRNNRDELARKWNIVTRITQEDFNNALLEMEKS